MGATTFCSLTTWPSLCGLTSAAASGFTATSSRPADTAAGDAGAGTAAAGTIAAGTAAAGTGTAAAGTVTAGAAAGTAVGAEVALMGPGWVFTFCTVFLTGFLEPVFEDGAGVAEAGAAE